MKEKLVSLAKSRYFIPTLMMIFSLSLVAYAATSIAIHNSVPITSGVRLAVVYQLTPFPGNTCPTPATNPSYSTTAGLSFSQPAGGTNDTFLCISNSGTGTATPTIAITQDPNNCGPGGTAGACFKLATNPSPSPIPPGSVSAQLTLTISNNYLLPPSPAQVPMTISVN